MLERTRDQQPRHIKQALNEIEWLNQDDIDQLINISIRIGRSLFNRCIHFDCARALIANAAGKAGFECDDTLDLFTRTGLLQGIEAVKVLRTRRPCRYADIFC